MAFLAGAQSLLSGRTLALPCQPRVTSEGAVRPAWHVIYCGCHRSGGDKGSAESLVRRPPGNVSERPQRARGMVRRQNERQFRG